MNLGKRCIHTALLARIVMRKRARWQVSLRVFSLPLMSFPPVDPTRQSWDHVFCSSTWKQQTWQIFQLTEAYKSPVEADHAYNCSLGSVLTVGAV
jgi:hypothetical protein